MLKYFSPWATKKKMNMVMKVMEIRVHGFIMTLMVNHVGLLNAFICVTNCTSYGSILGTILPVSSFLFYMNAGKFFFLGSLGVGRSLTLSSFSFFD